MMNLTIGEFLHVFLLTLWALASKSKIKSMHKIDLYITGQIRHNAF